MTAANRETQGRTAFLDFLRILAAFFVIVNHTNSYVFKALTPVDSQWHWSILWYYVSKTAVPIFIMISGACLLGKRDSYAKTGRRVLRTVLALVLASYLYFLWDAWVNYGLWPRAVDFGALFGRIWQGGVTDGFWYLPLYLGLLLTLPLWQKMASAMEKRDCEYLMALTFTAGAAWPLLSHYVPALELPKYLDQLIPCSYLGLFFAGHYLVKYREPRRNSVPLAAGALVLSLAVCWALTRLEFDRVEPGQMYWFMDERAAPALPVIAASLSLFRLAHCAFGSRRSGRLLAELGGCAFGIYLLQDLLIAESKNRLFLPLCEKMPAFGAALCWEAVVFAAALAGAWLLRRIPGVKRIL